MVRAAFSLHQIWVFLTPNYLVYLEALFESNSIVNEFQIQIQVIYLTMKKNTSSILVVFLLLSACVQRVDLRETVAARTRVVDAVKAGYPVKFSSYWDPGWDIVYQLDGINTSGRGASGWCSRPNKSGEWFQVSADTPKVWTDLVLQGRGDYDDWVTSFHVLYSLDGMYWQQYRFGLNFSGNSDRNSKRFLSFDPPIEARGIRVILDENKRHPCSRFGLFFREQY